MQDKGVLKSFSSANDSSKKNTLVMALTSFVVVILGVGTGYVLAGPVKSEGMGTQNTPEQVEVKEGEAGLDESQASEKEAPIGILKEGGIEGEGMYHLERPGGPTKNVYLTSTVLNLQSFVDKKVQVWGDTLAGAKAGWLMDVVKIKEVK